MSEDRCAYPVHLGTDPEAGQTLGAGQKLGAGQALATKTRLDMKARHCSTFAKFAVCALLLTTALTAKSQIVAEGPCIGACKSEVVGILAGIAVGSAALGIGVYYALHHGHSLTGCAVSGANGFELQGKGDQPTYALTGDVAAIKPGNRVRVSGKKEKQSASGPQQFLVEKLAKDYGSCTVATASR